MTIDYCKNKDGTLGERWNPITGCIKNLRICPLWQKCWARKRAYQRLCKVYPERYPPEDPFAPQFHKDRLEKPEHWRKPRGVYVAYMGDMFNKQVPDKWIEKVFSEVSITPRHRYLFLTKRPDRYLEFAEALHSRPGKLPKNAWYGTSINRNEDIHRLQPLSLLSHIGLKTYISLEPMSHSLARAIRKQHIEDRKGDEPDWVILGGWSKKDNSGLEEPVRRVTNFYEKKDVPVWHKDNLDFAYKQENPMWGD